VATARDELSVCTSTPIRMAPNINGVPGLTVHALQGDRPAGGYTVLVVDDEEAVRRLAVRMLTWTGYQAIEARHGREALAAIEQHNGPVHLVLTDIKMPGMNGRELGRHVEQRWPGKPMLYMSGFASEVFQGGLLEPGAPFLAKPFTQDDLTAKVRTILEGKASDSKAGDPAAAP
jgi:CheY-like chemotaxis protein